MSTVVGAFEAKTKLSELLDRVEAGEEIIITRRGREIARLTTPEPKETRPAKATAEELLRLAKDFKRGVKGEFSSSDIDRILYDEHGLPK